MISSDSSKKERLSTTIGSRFVVVRLNYENQNQTISTLFVFFPYILDLISFVAFFPVSYGLYLEDDLPWNRKEWSYRK